MKLRDATEGDASFLAWVMLAASRSHVERGVWEFVMDCSEQSALGFLEALARSDEVHWCHWTRFVVAEVEGEAAAALCGFDPTVHGQHALEPIVLQTALALGTTIEEIPAIAERAAVVGTVMPEYAGGAWVIENVATIPRFRRRGLADALMAAGLDRGRSLGFHRAQVTVALGNEPARQVYVKHGFRHCDEKRSAAFDAALGFPGVERLLRPYERAT